MSDDDDDMMVEIPNQRAAVDSFTHNRTYTADQQAR